MSASTKMKPMDLQDIRMALFKREMNANRAVDHLVVQHKYTLERARRVVDLWESGKL